MSEAPALQKKVNPIKYLINGSFGGLLTVLVGHPLDTIKVRLQTMPKPAPGAEPMYRGMIDCMQKTIKNEGVRGLYRGMTAPLTTIAPIFAVYFAGFALGKRFQQKDENTKLTYPQIYISGAFSGIFATFISAPGERVKCLLQVQMATGGKFKYNGMTDTLSKLYKEGGLRCVFRGGYATLMRDIPSNGLYFLIYEFCQDTAKKYYGSDDIGVWSALGAGGLAGMGYWILGMPADVLKSRLQTAPEGKYKYGIRSVFRELIVKDGPMALYRGVTPVMLRAFPANAACFFGIEIANTFFAKVAPNF